MVCLSLAGSCGMQCHQLLLYGWLLGALQLCIFYWWLLALLDSIAFTVEPPNKGHFGNRPFVLSSKVVPISEVCCILILYHPQNVKLGR